MFVLVLLFLTIFIAEGLGFERNTFLYIYTCLPAIISLFLLFLKKNIVIPKKLGLVFLAYLIIAFISFLFSVDKQNSFELALFYTSVFLIFIFFYNFKELGKKLITLEIFIGSLIFIVYFIVTFLFPSLKNLQSNGYQLTRSFFGLHNHLGDFLGLTIIYFSLINKIPFVLILLPVFILSYSRSAYLSLLITSLFVSVSKSIFSKKFFLILIGFCLFFWVSFSISGENSLFQQGLTQFHQSTGVETKSLDSNRFEYLRQSVLGFWESPILGWGSGNFGQVSYKFRQFPSDWTETPHNIFLSVLINNGILGLLPFLVLIYLILKHGNKTMPHYYLFVYLLVNFQTDYIYEIFSMFILFIILGALTYEEKDNLFQKNNLRVFLLISALLLLALTQLFFVKIVAKPESNGRNQEDFEKIYIANPYDNINLIGEIYRMKIKNVNKVRAWDFAMGELKKYKNMPNWKLNDEQKEHIRVFCDKFSPEICDEAGFSRYKYFYEPDPKKTGKVLKQIPLEEQYSINKDTLNDRFDYTVPKTPGVYRIVVLGDSSTFGLLVKTKDNWTEHLEDKLGKKFEVINLAVHGYDIPYEVERYRRRGIKYDPDLVLWFLNNGNFYQNNEIMSQKAPLIEAAMKNTEEYKKEISKGNYYPDWEKAYKQTITDTGEDELLKITESQFRLFREYYDGPIAIIDQSLSTNNKNIISRSLFEYRLDFISVNELEKPFYYFPKFGQINEFGHEMIAKKVFLFLEENLLN